MKTKSDPISGHFFYAFFEGSFLCGRRENDMLYRFRWLSTADTRLFRAEWRWKNHGVNEYSFFSKKEQTKKEQTQPRFSQKAERENRRGMN